MPASTLHVCTVQSNVKTEKSHEARTLGPRTLIVGPSGSGKSAIIDAVRFATTATVNDLNGREVVAEAGLLSTLTSHTEPSADLFAKVVLSDGRQSQSTLAKGKTKNGPTLSTISWPLDEVKKALGGGVDGVRTFLLSIIAEQITDATIEAAITLAGGNVEDYQKIAKTATGLYVKTPLETLGAVADTAKKRAADTKKEADAVEKHGQELANGLGPDPSDEEIAKAQTEYDEAVAAVGERRAEERRLRESALRAETERAAKILAKQKRARLEQQAEEALALYELRVVEANAAVGRVAELEERIDPVGAKLVPIKLARMTALGVVADWYLTVKLSDCLVCGGKVDRKSLLTLPNEVTAAIADIHAESTEYKALEDARRVVKQCDERVKLANDAALKLVEQCEALGDEAEVEDTAPIVPPEPLLPPSSAALDDLKRLKQQHIGVRRAFTSAGVARGNMERYKALHAICKDVTKQIVKDSVSAFEAKVQRYLPDTDRFGVQLLDGEREVARVGLWRGLTTKKTRSKKDDGSAPRLDTALSGSERVRVTTALACAEAARQGAELAIIATDDRSIDSVALRHLLDALSAEVEGGPALQILVATTTLPAEDDGDSFGPLQGWTIINTVGA